MMDKNRKTLFITLALVFFGILLLASVYAIKNDDDKTSQTNSPQVVQNYNGYITPQTAYTPRVVVTKPVQTYYLNKHEDKTDSNYNTYYYSERTSDNTLHYPPYENEKTPVNDIKYTQYGTEKTRDGSFEDYVKEYSVYITNDGNTGRYFTVTFNLEDKNGYYFNQLVTQYLKTDESKEFVYKDLQYEKNEILNWNYDITPQDY
jgi:hypothetical protein